MAYVVQVGDVLRMRTVCLQGTQIAINVRHWLVSAVAGGSVSDLAIAQHMDALFAPAYKGVMTTSASYRGCGVQRISPPPVLLEQTSNTNAGAGTVLGEPLAPQTTGLIKVTTAHAGRSGRGFIYLPFPGETDNVGNGIPSAGYRILAEAVGTIWVTPVTVGAAGNTATLNPVLRNAKTGAVTPITGRVFRIYWSQQKRRSYLRRGDIAPIL